MDLNSQVGDIRSDIATVLEGMKHVTERQRESTEEVKSIQARLTDGSARHQEFAASLADIETRLEELKPVKDTLDLLKAELDPVRTAVTDMKPQVKELMDWKAKLAGIFVVASAIMGFAVWFIWEGLKWLFPDAGKELFHRLFH